MSTNATNFFSKLKENYSNGKKEYSFSQYGVHETYTVAMIIVSGAVPNEIAIGINKDRDMVTVFSHIPPETNRPDDATPEALKICWKNGLIKTTLTLRKGTDAINVFCKQIADEVTEAFLSKASV